MLIYRLPGGRVVLRPSGTEPKIKCYIEIIEPLAGRSLAAAREAAAGGWLRCGPRSRRCWPRVEALTLAEMLEQALSNPPVLHQNETSGPPVAW